jgi:hypothetical protein
MTFSRIILALLGHFLAINVRKNLKPAPHRAFGSLLGTQFGLREKDFSSLKIEKIQNGKNQIVSVLVDKKNVKVWLYN